MVLAAKPLTQLMGMPDNLYLTILGIGLIVFAADLAFIAFKAADKPLFLKILLAVDISWIVASVILVLGFSSLFSIPGMILIDLAAIAVAGFAYSKYKGLRMLVGQKLQAA